jgi:hypothetical protein
MMSNKNLIVKSDFQIEKPGLESKVVKASVGIEIEGESGDLDRISGRVQSVIAAANIDCELPLSEYLEEGTYASGWRDGHIEATEKAKQAKPAEPVLDFRTDFENAPDIERVLFLVREECGLSQVRDGYVSKENECTMFFLEGILEAKRINGHNLLGWCPKPKITIDGEER